MVIPIISAFLRMLREEKEQKTWRQLAKEVLALIVFVSIGLVIIKEVDLLIKYLGGYFVK